MSYRDKPVLVTGADGFIGSHLCEALAREGARVRAFCFYNSNGSRGWLAGLGAGAVARAAGRVVAGRSFAEHSRDRFAAAPAFRP